MVRVGFIGLGNMGAFMARNLVKAGRQLVVFDTNQSVLSKFKTEGVAVASEPAGVASEATHIFTMLPNSQHVVSVFKSKGGLFE